MDLDDANQVYSELRALKVDLTFAIGGIKNHELYFEHLGGNGGDPDGANGDLIVRDFGSVDAWQRRPEGDGPRGARLGVDGVRLGRGPALQLHRRRAEHVPGLERDAARRARRLRARVLPRLPDRPCRLHRDVLRQSRLGRRERLGRRAPASEPDSWPVAAMIAAILIVAGYLAGSMPFGYWVVRAFKHVDIRTVGQREHRRNQRLAHLRPLVRGPGRPARRR